MVRDNQGRAVRPFTPDWVVEITHPGNGPALVSPGRTREQCEKWAEKFNRDVSKVSTSGRIKVARVISLIEAQQKGLKCP